MPRYVAFLRAINAGNGHSLKMGALRDIFISLGFADVSTFFATGNVLFTTPVEDARVLEREIEIGLRDALGYEVATFIRTGAELAEIASQTPFGSEEFDAYAEYDIIFLAGPLDENQQQKLSARSDTDIFRFHGCEIFWLRRRRPGAAAFSSPSLAKLIKGPFTMRGAPTVRHLASKANLCSNS